MKFSRLECVQKCLGESIDVRQVAMDVEDSSHVGLRNEFFHLNLSWIIRTFILSSSCFHETHDLDGV